MMNVKHSAPRKPDIPVKRKHPVRRQLRPWGYSLPAMILIAMIVLFPILYTGYISLTNMNLYHWTDYSLVGADNYKRALLKVDSGFLSALGTTILWTAVNMVLDTAIAYVLAVALNTQGLRRSACTNPAYFPWAMPAYVSILVWRVECSIRSSGCLISFLWHSDGKSGFPVQKCTAFYPAWF
ncbi:MAG: carbohydrate ABC transporter permease [Eisenbergiella massiliensis]